MRLLKPLPLSKDVARIPVSKFLKCLVEILLIFYVVISERICDTIAEVDFSSSTREQCINVPSLVCNTEERTVFEKTCKTETTFDCSGITASASTSQSSGFVSSSSGSASSDYGSSQSGYAQDQEQFSTNPPAYSQNPTPQGNNDYDSLLIFCILIPSLTLQCLAEDNKINAATLLLAKCLLNLAKGGKKEFANR